MKIGSSAGTVLALIGAIAATPAFAEVSTAPEGAPGPISKSQGPTAIPLPSAPDPVPLISPKPLVGIEPYSWNLAQVSSGNDTPGVSAEVAALAAAMPAGEPDHFGTGTVAADPPAEAGPPNLAATPDAPRMRWSDHLPRSEAPYNGFFAQASTVKTETLLFTGYFMAISAHKFFEDTAPFHFKDEGYFGKNTDNIGVDKLTHAFDTYLIAEFLHNRIHNRTGASQGDAITAAIIASGLMAFNEISDAIEPDSGYSLQDVSMNIAGAALSVLRNTVPGMKEKFSFKVEIIPNDKVWSIQGKPHYAQQRYMFSLKGAGFEKLHNTPLRFVDLQVGYFASDFLNEDRAAGKEPKRHLFVGVGLNLGELLFAKSQSKIGRMAYSVLDYVQIPYTSVRYDTTGQFDF